MELYQAHSTMDEERLIALVEQYPELYDQSAPKYNDEQRRNAIWQQIGKTIDETPAECKDKWKKIRDNYRKALNLRISKKEQGIKNIKPIRYGRELVFLNLYIQKERKPSERETATSEDEQSSRASPLSAPASPPPLAATTAMPRPKKRIKTEEAPTSTDFLFQPCSDNVNSDTDTVVEFFKCLGETVKQFPLDLQVRVKSDVFNIVNQAEAECVQRMNIN